jgi:acetyl-CoA synthetase
MCFHSISGIGKIASLRYLKAMHAFRAARDFLLRHRSDYGPACAQFRWPALEEFNWALDWFDAVLASDRATCDLPALWITNPERGADLKLSFRELSDRSNAVANFLRRHGVRRGERILLLVAAEGALWECVLAAMKLGAVIVPATTLLTPAEIADRVGAGRIEHILAGADQVEKVAVEAVRNRFVIGRAAPGWITYAPSEGDRAFEPEGVTRADDPLLMYFTSGTTSRPKLVLHTHYSYPVGHLSTMYWLGVQPGDIHLNISSPGWAKHAWSSIFAPWNAGACVLVVNQPRFSPSVILDELERRRVTTMCAPPTAWRHIAQESLGGRSLNLRELCSAGEPLNAEIIDRFRSAWGLVIRDGYGQTETTAQVGNTPGQEVFAGSMGRPLPGYKVALLDAQGNPNSTEGELSVPLGADRPAGLMHGYEINGQVRVLEGDFYRSADLVQRDARGYLTFVGRSDDVFKSSDYRISPFELESALIEHPEVLEAAVVAWPDPLRLSIPKAFIVKRPAAPADSELATQLFVFLEGRLAPFKRIRVVEFCPELPKTISGKIRRAALRQQSPDDSRCYKAPARAQDRAGTTPGEISG